MYPAVDSQDGWEDWHPILITACITTLYNYNPIDSELIEQSDIICLREGLNFEQVILLRISPNIMVKNNI